MPGLTGEVANLIVSLKLDDRGFSGKLNTIGRSLGQLDSGLSQMGKGVGQVGSGLARLGTVAAAAAAGGLAAVVTTAATMEEAFIGIQKTVDETASTSFDELRAQLRGMSSDTGVAFEELAAIGEAGGALGVGADSLEAFIDVVNRLAVSTNLSSDAAATALGQLGTILHLEGAEFEDFADSLVALGNAGASTEDQIIALAARFAAAGNSAGLTKEEILAVSSAVASMGIEVEAGGTALSQTFNGITQAIGTGADEVNAFTDTLNISAAEFKERWTRDALGTFQAFLAELAKLDQFEQAKVLEDAGITGVRQLNAVKLMTQNLGFFGEQLDVSREAAGALDEESDKFFKSAANQFRRLRENVRLVANTIGTELLPVTNELITDFIGELNKPATQAGIKAFAQDLASGVRGLVGELKGTDFSGIISGMKLAAEVAKGAFDAFRALPAPIQQLAIAALVANKVSGGAVGLIAKGLGNILLGGVKVGGGLAGLFGGRGGSPANPMFVAVTNQIPGAGGVPVAGARGVLGTIGNVAAKVFIAGIAVEAGFVLGKVFSEALIELGVGGIKPAREFEQGAFEAAIDARDVSRIVAGLDSIDEQLAPSLTDLGLSVEDSGQAIALALDFGGVRTRLEDQREVLLDLLTEMGLTRAQAEAIAGNTTPTSPKGPVLGPPVPTGPFATLSSTDFISKLSQSTEIGLKDIGTSIEHGITTGLDPFGQGMLALAQSVENPKDPVVLTEIKNHIIAAEELQQSYLTAGDINSAKEVQTTIDGLNTLAGSVDKIKPNFVTLIEQQRQTKAQTAESARLTGIANSYLSTVAAKEFSPTINLTNATTVQFGLTALQTQINRIRIAGTTTLGGVMETSYS